MAFAKIKTLIRKAAARTCDQLWQAVGNVCNLFKDEECHNFFKAAGYETDRTQHALGPVENQCELMRAATAWIIAANEVSVMSARRALRLNSLSLQIEGSPATGSRQCPKLPDAVPAFGKLQVDGQGGATSRVLGNADHRTAFVHRRNDPIAVEGVAIGARTNGAPMATRPVSHRT